MHGRTTWRLGAVLLLALAPCALGEEPAVRVVRLVEQLGSDQAIDRETATQALDALGSAALAALREAEESDDPEIARRARDLVERIARRVEAAALLVPRRVRLQCDDVSVRQAVAELAKQSGFTIEAEGDRAALDERTISLRAADAPFWEVFDKLCSQAGLVHRIPLPIRDRYGYGSQVMIINGNMIVPYAPRADTDEPESRLFVAVGKPTPMPTCSTGPLRVRALPPGVGISGERRVAGESVVALEVSIEPELRWLRATAVRVHRAVAEGDRNLEQILPAPPERPAPSTSSRGMIIVNGMVMNQDETPYGNPRHLPVRLRVGEKPPQKVRELAGSITAVVLTAPQPLVRIDNLLQAEGKLVAGPAGCSVRVLEAELDGDGVVRVRVQVTPPPTDVEDGITAAWGRTVVANGRVISGATAEVSGTSFALLDAKGRPFPVAGADGPVLRPSGLREYRLTFAGGETGVELGQLVYNARRAVVVDVPFALADVPLP